MAPLLGRIIGALDIAGQDPDRMDFSVRTGAGESTNQIRCLSTDRTRRSPHSKTVVRLRVPWVRIRPPPPASLRYRHTRRPDKTGDKCIVRAPIELQRRSDLLDIAVAEYDDLVSESALLILAHEPGIPSHIRGHKPLQSTPEIELGAWPTMPV